ncbi:helix-turn-helix transcriptional regulator [Mesorhizobium sp. B2-4-8]|nr:helix-turn-helix transcriptional regulator [Mesorhizobium sp. B2-4-8]
MLDASQIKAARALIDWSQGDLAEKSGLALATIKRMEKLGPGRSALSNVEAVKAALERAGVLFIDANGNGVGVRLRASPSSQSGKQDSH